MNTATPARRPYRMANRAAAAAETRRRIVQATIELHAERFHDEISLADIAERAGVTVQTILRGFGSKEGLIDAAAADTTAQVVSDRASVPVGDAAAAVRYLVDHYEALGPPVLRLLAQEDRVPQLRRITDRGRAIHQEWVRRTFAPFLERGGATALHAQLVAITDMYFWKVLRIDLGLDPAGVEAAMLRTLRAVLGEGGHA